MVAMSLLFFLIALSIVSIATSSSDGAELAGVDGGDIAALRAFASKIHGGDSLRSWRQDGDACSGSWIGVGCSWIHCSKSFRVVSLRLPNSGLAGELSHDLGLLSELKVLDLSGNKLYGSIPEEISRLPKLRFIDFSNNALGGRIPRSGERRRNSPFRNAAAFAGNPDLCGPPLPRKCHSSIIQKPRAAARSLLQDVSPRPAPSPSSSTPSPAPSRTPTTTSSPAPAPAAATRRRHRRSKAQRWGIGAALGVVAGSIAGLIVGLITRVGIVVYKRSRSKNGPIIFYHKISPKSLAFLDSPDAFQQMPELGSGGAGKVYRATLDNGMEVAVKRIPTQQSEPTSGSGSSGKGSFGKRHMVAEMETLGQIRHVNLAWLYAYIPKPDAHLLLYQYMPGGSLLDMLTKVRDGAAQLDWPSRRRIAIGMVTGLKYLHYDCSPKILHRDLKTSNILLDENLEAHLGDFGLAKALPDDMTHVTTQVAGTIGYIAPEYHQTCKFTTSSDVYSMGIVLGVLVSGREPTEFPDGIVTMMCHLVQTGQEVEGIDPTLLHLEEGGEGGFQNVEQISEMKLMMRIVCLCTKAIPVERPSIKDVLLMLNPSKMDRIVRPMEELIRSDDY